MSYSFGDSLTSLPSTLTMRLTRSTDRSPVWKIGFSPCCCKPVPQRHADARDKFVHAERLGDIVVGAELERLDDAGLVGAARQDEDGQVQPLVAPFAQQVVAAACRAGRDRAG